MPSTFLTGELFPNQELIVVMSKTMLTELILLVVTVTDLSDVILSVRWRIIVIVISVLNGHTSCDLWGIEPFFLARRFCV
jgi:hypothetical protein